MKVEIEDKEFMELLLSVKEKTKEIDALKAKVKELENGTDLDKKIMDAVNKALKMMPVPYYYPVPYYTHPYPYRPYWDNVTYTNGATSINDTCGLNEITTSSSVFTSSVGDNLTFGTWSTPDTEVMYGVS